MRPSLVFLVLLLLAAIASSWWLERLPTVPATPQLPEAAAPSPAPVPAERADRAAGEHELLRVPPPLPTEFADRDWMKLRRSLVPGELEVLVLRAKEPVAGARVRVWPRRAIPLGREVEDDPSQDATTDATGRVRFVRVAAGDYAVRADADAAHVVTEATVAAVGSSAHAAHTAIVLFGAATILGSVRDDHGAPRGGLAVHVVGGGRLPIRGSSTVTDATGNYEVHALHGGRYHVQLDRLGQTWSPANERMVTLRTGECARMDFGGVMPSGSLRGRVVDGEGQPVAGERRVRVRHAEHNDERGARTDSAGVFVLPLPPGRWQVSDDDAADPPVLGEADIGRGEVAIDVLWPGIRFLAIVHAGPDVDSADLRPCLQLTPATRMRGVHSGGQPEATFTADGRTFLQWTGLAAGVYRMQVGNGFEFVDTAPEGVVVRLSAAPVQRVPVNVRRRPLR